MAKHLIEVQAVLEATAPNEASVAAILDDALRGLMSQLSAAGGVLPLSLMVQCQGTVRIFTYEQQGCPPVTSSNLLARH